MDDDVLDLRNFKNNVSNNICNISTNINNNTTNTINTNNTTNTTNTNSDTTNVSDNIRTLINDDNNKKDVSKIITEYSIKILKEVDVNNCLKKTELIKKLEDLILTTNDIIYVEAINYLLDNLENLEERLIAFSNKRKTDDNNILSDIIRLDTDTFKTKISLTSDEKQELDESERIFLSAKKEYSKPIYSKYLKLDEKEMKKRMNKLLEKKKIDKNIMEKYNIV